MRFMCFKYVLFVFIWICEDLLRFLEICDGFVRVCFDFEKYVPFVAHVSARRGFFFGKTGVPRFFDACYVNLCEFM